MKEKFSEIFRYEVIDIEMRPRMPPSTCFAVPAETEGAVERCSRIRWIRWQEIHTQAPVEKGVSDDSYIIANRFLISLSAHKKRPSEDGLSCYECCSV
jgi:hypothetical protein